MKFIKRIFCALLACQLMAPAAAVAEEPVQLTPYLLGSVTWTKTDEWYETDTTRALFAATMWCDVILSENRSYKALMADAIDADCIFVSTSKDALSAYFFSGANLLTATFSPSGKTLTVDVQVASSSAAVAYMDTLKGNGGVTGYSQVTSDLFLECLEFVMDTLPQ